MTWMTESGVSELDWPAHNLDLNLIEKLRGWLSYPTSVCDLTNALLDEW